MSSVIGGRVENDLPFTSAAAPKPTLLPLGVDFSAVRVFLRDAGAQGRVMVAVATGRMRAKYCYCSI